MSVISPTRKKGRPSVGATSIHLRLEPEILAGLDAWIAKRGGDISRQGALRVLVESTVGAAAMNADEFKKAILNLAVNAEQSFATGGLETVKTERRTDGSMSVSFYFRKLNDHAPGKVRTVNLG